MKPTSTALIAACAFALCGAACAQQKLMPGQWELSVTMKGAPGGESDAAMAKMQAQLAAMPPDQRKMVEQMMAQRGMSAGGGAMNMRSVKVCVTKEQAERGEPPNDDARCKRDALVRSGDTVKFKVSCSGEPPSSGEGELTFSSPTAYSGRMTIDTLVNGKPEHVEMQQSGRWVAADCKP